MLNLSGEVREQGRGDGHAVVIGGSLAGMLAARVLCEHFGRVTVVERDRYPAGVAARKGVPQSSHLHGLMLRGQSILEQLFPGLGKELVAAGANAVDMTGEVAWLTPAGWAARFTSGLTALSFTRPLLDHHVRRRMASLPNVRFLEGTEVKRLVPRDGGRSVIGVALEARDRGACEELLEADLVVDASGRGSRAPRWLEQLGYRAPEETVVNAFLGYASRLYRNPEGFDDHWKGVYVQAAPPEGRRAGILLPVEGGRWLLTLGGRGRDYPPTDDAGFLEFARSLRSPLIYDAVRRAEPLSPVTSFRANENRLRRYDRLSALPHNFVVMGDAACAFNPVYGQGMTTAALGAIALDESLREQRRRPGGGLRGFAPRFQKRLARVNAGPWLMATSEDCRYPNTEGGRRGPATRFMHGYMDAVTRLSTKDAGVRRLLLENIHMLKRPTSLFSPGVVLRVIKQAISIDAAVHESASPAPAVSNAAS